MWLRKFGFLMQFAVGGSAFSIPKNSFKISSDFPPVNFTVSQCCWVDLFY